MQQQRIKPADIAGPTEHLRSLALQAGCIVDLGARPEDVAAGLVTIAGGVLLTFLDLQPADIEKRIVEFGAMVRAHLDSAPAADPKICSLPVRRVR